MVGSAAGRPPKRLRRSRQFGAWALGLNPNGTVLQCRLGAVSSLPYSQ